MKLRRIAAFLLAAILSVSVLSGCSDSNGDWSYIEKKGKMTIGITLFEPMNYYGDDGALTGFETEFATEVCNRLGIEAEFQEIDWNSKETELNSKNIDCIWNGMTITDERRETMNISTEYMANKQVLVCKAENAGLYADTAAFEGKSIVAEQGSAGEEVASTDALFASASYTPVDSQAKTLLEVKAGTADLAVIDYVMSIGSIGEGTDYSDLAVVDNYEFSPEEYGIAFRKGCDETLNKVNAVIDEMKQDGSLAEIASKYKLEDLILYAVG